VQLAALGAVADLVPLLAENRALVARGLQALRDAPLPGLRELGGGAGRSLARADAETVAFFIAPRLNAAGRMGSAAPALELLTTNVPLRGRTLAARLEALNVQRQAELREHLARARAELLGQGSRTAYVLAGDFPLGIVGLRAGRLADECGRPTVVLHVANGVARGSGRGPHWVDLVAALTPSAPLLRRFGGHARAAGVTLSADLLTEFEAVFCDSVGRLAPSSAETESALDVDCVLSHLSINAATLAAVGRLEPCGQGNPRPVFLSRALRVRSVRPVGSGHAAMYLDGRAGSVRAIAFRQAASAPPPDSLVDLVYHLRADEYAGGGAVELEVLDWQPSAILAPAPPATYTPVQ
jgi:single-stranded-DNA-specific exonuclease